METPEFVATWSEVSVALRTSEYETWVLKEGSLVQTPPSGCVACLANCRSFLLAHGFPTQAP